MFCKLKMYSLMSTLAGVSELHACCSHGNICRWGGGGRKLVVFASLAVLVISWVWPMRIIYYRTQHIDWLSREQWLTSILKRSQCIITKPFRSIHSSAISPYLVHWVREVKHVDWHEKETLEGKWISLSTLIPFAWISITPVKCRKTFLCVHIP